MLIPLISSTGYVIWPVLPLVGASVAAGCASFVRPWARVIVSGRNTGALLVVGGWQSVHGALPTSKHLGCELRLTLLERGDTRD